MFHYLHTSFTTDPCKSNPCGVGNCSSDRGLYFCDCPANITSMRCSNGKYALQF